MNIGDVNYLMSYRDKMRRNEIRRVNEEMKDIGVSGKDDVQKRAGGRGKGEEKREEVGRTDDVLKQAVDERW